MMDFDEWLEMNGLYRGNPKDEVVNCLELLYDQIQVLRMENKNDNE